MLFDIINVFIVFQRFPKIYRLVILTSELLDSATLNTEDANNKSGDVKVRAGREVVRPRGSKIPAHCGRQ